MNPTTLAHLTRQVTETFACSYCDGVGFFIEVEACSPTAGVWCKCKRCGGAGRIASVYVVSIAAGDLRELLGWYRAGYSAALKAAVACANNLPMSENRTLVPFDGAWEIGAMAVANAIAALPVPEAPTVQEDIT